MLPQDTGALDPETNNSFELGLKARLADGRAALNIAAFDSKLKNYQVNFVDVFNGSQITRLINAGAVSTEASRPISSPGRCRG